jgi:methenyltetrahydrofolate cyclohydrolase
VTGPEFLDALAAPTPDPGGGAASAAVLALAGALAAMVTGYSPDACAAEPALPVRVQRIRDRAAALATSDGIASAAFARAWRMPEGTSAERAERERAVVAACLGAAESALEIADVATGLLADLRVLDRLGEPRVHADVRVAAAAVGAVLRASVANVETSVEHAQATGATAAVLVGPVRRMADVVELIDVADSLASRQPVRNQPARSQPA